MATLIKNQALRAWLMTIMILAIFTYVSTQDYKDNRFVECYKQGQGYNSKTDKCEGER